MKKLLLLFAFMLTICGTAMAQTVGDCFASNGLRYKITSLSPNTVEVTTMSDNAAQHYSMTEVNIPVRATYSNEVFTITAIGGGANFTTAAFYNSEIETIKFASGSQIAEIGDYAFYKSTATSITMPTSLATIGKSAFEGCTALQTVNLQEGLTTIGQSAFKGCKALQSITIPASVSSIGQSAFFGCTALAEVTVKWTDAASIPVLGTGAFGSIAKGAVLIVPVGTKELYEAKGWNQWFTINAGGGPQPDECDPITEFPYFNDFENFLDEKDCWISIDADGDDQDWITGTRIYWERELGVDGSHCIASESFHFYYDGEWSSYNADNYLVSPKFELPADETVTLSWQAMGMWGWGDRYEVMIAPNGSTNISDFVSVYSEASHNTWTERSVDISAYAGTTVRVVFRHNDSNQYAVLIDNMGITLGGSPEPDECDPITEFPYFNDFEDFLTNHDCWISIDADGDGQDWITGTAQSGKWNGYNSSTGLISKSYDYVVASGGISTDIDANNYLLSPKFVLPANKTMTLSWYVCSEYGPAYPDWYEVMIAPNGSTDINDFVQILNELGPSDWEQRTIDISEYAGTTVRVVFHHQDYAKYWIKIDNLGITVEGPEYDVMEITANQDPEHKTHYYSTFYSSTNAYKVPEDVMTYTGVVNGDVLKLAPIADGIIPASKGVILRLTSEDNTSTQQIALTATTETGTWNGTNALTGTDVEMTLGANDYALSYGDNGVGFYLWENKPISAHKAYLTLPSGAKALVFDFDEGTTTGIKNHQPSTLNPQPSLYNLNGVRVDDSYKGIVIKNGKKFYQR